MLRRLRAAPPLTVQPRLYAHIPARFSYSAPPSRPHIGHYPYSVPRHCPPPLVPFLRLCLRRYPYSGCLLCSYSTRIRTACRPLVSVQYSAGEDGRCGCRHALPLCGLCTAPMRRAVLTLVRAASSSARFRRPITPYPSFFTRARVCLPCSRLRRHVFIASRRAAPSLPRRDIGVASPTLMFIFLWGAGSAPSCSLSFLHSRHRSHSPPFPPPF